MLLSARAVLFTDSVVRFVVSYLLLSHSHSLRVECVSVEGFPYLMRYGVMGSTCLFLR